MLHSPRDSLALKHYVRFWGDSNDVFEINRSWKTPPGPILIAEFAPDTENQAWVYGTIGTSRYPMPYPADRSSETPGRRVELFIYARQRNNKLVALLSSLAEYPFEKSTFLGVGHTIPGDVGVISGSYLTDILFVRPYNEPTDFEVLHVEGAIHVHMLWVVPIHKSERKFIITEGWKALVGLFSKNEIDTSDFFRAPVI